MEAVLKFFVDFKIGEIAIGSVGLFGLYLIFDRFKALYFDLALPTQTFMKQIMRMLEQDKIEEAVTFCGANEKKPLAYVVKRILERADREEEAMFDALDIAASEVGPKVSKNLGHLAMVANVVTLVGLLGTVCGLIVAFKAVSFADVSQKQTLLAQGISIAMTSTACALMVAIPTMFLYSFLHAKQTKLLSEIDLHTHKVIEFMKNRGYVPFAHDTVYPNGMRPEMVAKGKTPPPPKPRVA